MSDKGSVLVGRKEQALDAPKGNERNSALAAENMSGRRLESVTIEDGALVMAGTAEAQQRAADSFGSESREFQTYCIAQLVAILPEQSGGDDYTLPINAAVAMLSAINPRDEFEAMLAVQMVASNHLSLMSMRRTTHAQTIDSGQLNGSLANKFARTFVAQMEALSKHRRNGKQIVEHVHIGAGGQAVIAGTVNTGGRG